MFIYPTNRKKTIDQNMITKDTNVLLTGPSFDAHGLHSCLVDLSLLVHAVRPSFAVLYLMCPLKVLPSTIHANIALNTTSHMWIHPLCDLIRNLREV